MSHIATAWLSQIPAAKLTAGQFRVLFFLCDAHNSRREPEEACFPSQSLLREGTGLSNGGLNNCLNSLEALGFIKRIRTTEPGSHMRRTCYVLGCDMSAEQTPHTGDSTSKLQKLEPEQTPLSEVANSTFGGSKLQTGGVTTKAEPVKEPVKEPVLCDVENQADDIGILFANLPEREDAPDRFQEFWNTYPHRGGVKRGRSNSEKSYRKAISSGVPADVIISGAERAKRDPQVQRGYAKDPSTWLNGKCWEDEIAPSSAPEQSERVRRYRQIVRDWA